MSALLEEFAQSVLRIEVMRKNGSCGTGSGFLVNFQNGIICLVTNKHIIDNHKQVCVVFTKSDGGTIPLYGQHQKCDITDCLDLAIMHPSDNVDLVAIPIAPITNEYERKGISLFIRCMDISAIPSRNEMRRIPPGTDILTAGFPLNLIDEFNNLPIVRKGVISTIPTENFNDSTGFLIDVSSANGSSGSPVVVKKTKLVVDTSGKIQMDEAVFLVGIQYASITFFQKARLKSVDSTFPLSIDTPQSANLAYAIPAYELLTLDSILFDRYICGKS